MRKRNKNWQKQKQQYARAKGKLAKLDRQLDDQMNKLEDHRGRERMPTMAERDERDRQALERLRRLNQQDWDA